MANWANVGNVGDPLSPGWQEANLEWIEPIAGQRWQVNKRAKAAFEGLLGDLVKLGYHPTSSGGFNYRNIRGGDKLSQHAFGTAIDLNSLTNAMGQSGTDIPHAAELAAKWGLDWGGNWKGRPDPMHFEYQGQDDGGAAAASAALNPQQQWMQGLWQYAQAASAKTGVDPRLIMAQAALETGYGKSAPNNAYFGIKGKGSTQKTLEFINGRMQPVQADFRAYASPQESFEDYADLLMGSRYAGVRGGKNLEEQVAALGKSGYATDPDYAAKIMKIAQGIPEGGFGQGGAGAALGAAAAKGAASGAGGAATPPAAAPAGQDKSKLGDAIAGAFGGLGDVMGGSSGGFSQPVYRTPVAAQQAAPSQVLAMAAPTQRDENYRNQLAALMQQYWIT